MTTKSIGAVIVAAGRGLRAGGEIPKQWQSLAGRRVIDHTLAAFEAHPAIGPIVVVIHPDDVSRATFTGHTVVHGGATRGESVRNGLATLTCDAVLIHDAARACVSSAVIDRVVAALETAPGAAPGLPVVDALWEGRDGTVLGPRPRDNLYRAQTPQGFHLDAIRAAHDASDGTAADDVEVALAAGLDVTIVEGDEANIKITGPGDFARAARILEGPALDIRMGNGFDVHAFGPGDGVTLCGVTIPFDRGLSGHSDADVGMHAVTDAIYGALARGDIGQHFPPSEAQWKGADSAIFLKHSVGLAAELGYRVNHVDCTLICEFPKIGPHASAMRVRMAGLMRLREDQVSVKATTSETLGFTGRGEGIAALATATLVPA
ncbi:MAG: bifunctional 2-C-methyl-D-erythritol 4-phosphate cytidylyltransferase/2-C-methyl-D-erythritol 2,4-cyclodiphosphate synthase [Shimia sp.]